MARPSLASRIYDFRCERSGHMSPYVTVCCCLFKVGCFGEPVAYRGISRCANFEASPGAERLGFKHSRIIRMLMAFCASLDGQP